MRVIVVVISVRNSFSLIDSFDACEFILIYCLKYTCLIRPSLGIGLVVAKIENTHRYKWKRTRNTKTTKATKEKDAPNNFVKNYSLAKNEINTHARTHWQFFIFCFLQFHLCWRISIYAFLSPTLLFMFCSVILFHLK